MATSSTLLLADQDGPFQRYLATARSDINDHLRHVLQDRDLPLKIDAHIMGGKRLRGGLTLLLHDALDGNDRPAALDLAAAVEIAHSICLIIDDMLDGDMERRGEASVHVDLGVGQALLEAFDLLSVPYALASGHGRDAVGAFASVHHMIVNGAKIELSAPDTSWERYHAIISRKTGELFALSAAYGAMAAGAGPTAVEGAREYGMRCGIAYQVIDDILDMDHTGESRGCSGPMLSRLLRAGTERGTDVSIDYLCRQPIDEARKAAEAIIDIVPRTVPRLRSCLAGAPAEMARMMLR